MLYHINEGLLVLPDADIQDMTVNLINFKQLGTTFVVSRSDLKEGESYIDNYKSQLAQLKERMKNFKILAFTDTEITIGSNNDINALECRNSFELNEQLIEQCQCVIGQKNKIMVLAYSKAGGLGAEGLAHWQHIKCQFSLRN